MFVGSSYIQPGDVFWAIRVSPSYYTRILFMNSIIPVKLTNSRVSFAGDDDEDVCHSSCGNFYVKEYPFVEYCGYSLSLSN